MPYSTPFILFEGKCAEAMTFYQNSIGGELTVTRLGDTSMKEQMPKDLHDRIVYAHLKNGDINISATDWLHTTRKPKQGNTVAIYLTGTFNELKEVFDRLSDEAPKELLDELKIMPFGIYGHIADKYGIHWFFKGVMTPDKF